MTFHRLDLDFTLKALDAKWQEIYQNQNQRHPDLKQTKEISQVFIVHMYMFNFRLQYHYREVDSNTDKTVDILQNLLEKFYEKKGLKLAIPFIKSTIKN